MNKDLFYDAVRDCETLQEKADFVTLIASVEGARVPGNAIEFAMDFYKRTDQHRKAESLSDFTGVVDEEVETWKKERKQAEREYDRMIRDDDREHMTYEPANYKHLFVYGHIPSTDLPLVAELVKIAELEAEKGR